MWFVCHPFDLATVTPPRYMRITRENSQKRKKYAKACRLPSLKPESKITVGSRWWFITQAAKPLQFWAVEFSKEYLCCTTLIYTEHPPKSSTADWLGDNILDILPLKPDFLHGCELMTTGSQALCLHSQDEWPSTTLMDPRVLWEGTDIPNPLTYSQNRAFLSSLHPTQASVSSSHNQTPQVVIEVIALVCLRAP